MKVTVEIDAAELVELLRLFLANGASSNPSAVAEVVRKVKSSATP